MSENIPPFFWLHVRKSAGTSVQKMLSPHYKTVQKDCKPYTFIQADPSEYNDILNNYRIPLGSYQYKRSLFAKEVLYKENWDQLYSFAFSREPIDRCISSFFYMYYRKNINNFMRRLDWTRKFRFGISSNFDLFLDLVEESHQAENFYEPINLHFTTHVAGMHGDVTDHEGNVILKKIYRTEDLISKISQIYDDLGLKRDHLVEAKSNVNSKKLTYTPSKSQRLRIEKIYQKDFEIYENAE